MPEECQYLRVRLDMEQYRLLDWSQVAGVDGSTAKHDSAGAGGHLMRGTIQLNRHLILDVLSAIRTVLLDFGKVNGRYEDLRPVTDDGSRPQDSEKPGQTLSAPNADPAPRAAPPKPYARRLRGATSSVRRALAVVDQASQVPQRLRWAAFDKAKFEGLLKKLTELNDFLQGIMDESQAKALQITQHHTHMEVLQLSSDVKQLQHLIRALSYSEASAVSQGDVGSGSDRFLSPAMANRTEEKRTLARLARFKAFNASTGTSSDIKSNEIEIRHLVFQGNPSQVRTEALYRASSSVAPNHVWIEWKLHDSPGDMHQGPNSYILKRVQQLAALLGQRSKPKEFRTPHCVGYCYDDGNLNEEGEPRFGFVFEKPEEAMEMRTTSLLELISESDVNNRTQPSLTERLALARNVASCLLYLHSVNWLHKGLRSQNILFFANRERAVLRQPYITGFDYARPAGSEEMTEKPPENAEYDMYRHPKLHGDSGPREGFRKSYDIYSLGVILFEIAYWQPIQIILGITDLSAVPPKVTAAIQRTLLGDRRYMDGIASLMGDTYQDVTRACLFGLEAFGIAETADESRDVVGAQLQAAFSESVVERLESLEV